MKKYQTPGEIPAWRWQRMADIVRICVEDVASDDRCDYRNQAILFAGAAAGILEQVHGLKAVPATGAAWFDGFASCDPDAWLRGELRPGSMGPYRFEHSWCEVRDDDGPWVVDLNVATHIERTVALGAHNNAKRHINVLPSDGAPYVADTGLSIKRTEEWFSIPLYNDMVGMAVHWYGTVKRNKTPNPLQVLAQVEGKWAFRTLRYKELKLYGAVHTGA